ncbi:MAG TPA: acyltransferase, partial [Streptosporangiaceae bacterium]|nr:acyltransferase [Streptosporangiaceae bacterium]
PFWAAWMTYGRFAVVMFIALSGFSLGLGPARSRWRFKSIATYAHRRAWRILPPYWAALGFSLVMTWFVLAEPGWPVPNGKSVVVYGLFGQDVFSVGSPNRAFWSIAIEAQLYVLLPLLLLVRRVSARAMVGLVAAIVVTIGLLGPHVPLMNSALAKFTPDLAVLFAVGLLAAGIVTAGEHTRSRPWAGYALAATVPAIALMVVKGSTWSSLNLFWLDLAWAPAIGCFLAAIATSRPRPVVRFLDSLLPRSLGSYSYSLYLTHMPIVIAVSYGLVLGRVATGTPTFFVLAAILLPVTVCFARLFAAVFELPFQRHRGWTVLRQAMSARLWQLRRTGPAVVAGRWRGASRASGPRNQAGGRYRPARPRPVAGRARPASRPGPPVLPGPGDSAARSGSCQGCSAGSKPNRLRRSRPGRRARPSPTARPPARAPPRPAGGETGGGPSGFPRPAGRSESAHPCRGGRPA